MLQKLFSKVQTERKIQNDTKEVGYKKAIYENLPYDEAKERFDKLKAINKCHTVIIKSHYGSGEAYKAEIKQMIEDEEAQEKREWWQHQEQRGSRISKVKPLGW